MVERHARARLPLWVGAFPMPISRHGLARQRTPTEGLAITALTSISTESDAHVWPTGMFTTVNTRGENRSDS